MAADEVQTRVMLDELIAAWKRDLRLAPFETARRDGDVVGITVFGLTAHAYHLAEAVLCLYDRGLYAAAVPLVRQALECSLTAAWVEVAGAEAARALMDEQSRNQANTVHEFVKAGFPESSDAARSLQENAAAFRDSRTPAGRSFATRCAELEGGTNLYAVYRAASYTSHAGTAVADLYLWESGDGPYGVTLDLEPTDETRETWLGCLLSVLVVAELALTRLDRTRGHRSRLKQIAREIQVSDKTRLTAVGLKAQRERAGAAKRRRQEQRNPQAGPRPRTEGGGARKA